MAKRATVEDVKKVALTALATALDDGKQEARKKPGLTGVRAVATGAVLYTGARAAISSRRFIRDRLGASEEEDHADEQDDRDDDDQYDADAEADEDFDDEDEEEPAAEEDEDFEDDEDEEEPAAEEDEDYDDDEDDERHGKPSERPPVHGDAGDEDLPDRPSRRRKPVPTS